MATNKHRQRLQSISSIISEQRGFTSGGVIACMALVLLSVISFSVVYTQHARKAQLRYNNRQHQRALLEGAKETVNLLNKLEQNLPDAIIAVGNQGGEPEDIVDEVMARIIGLENVTVEEYNGKPFVTVTNNASFGEASVTAKACYRSSIKFYLARELALGWKDYLMSSPENLDLNRTTRGLNVRVNSTVDGDGSLVASIVVEHPGTGFSYYCVFDDLNIVV